MNKPRFFRNLVILLMLAGSFSSCGKDKIDFNNIENLYEQPLEVIQKAVQGKWKLQYSYGGFIGQTIVDTHGTYMHISKDRIIMGSNTHGVTTDSPIIWEKWENFNGIEITYLLSYNHHILIFEQDGVIYEERPIADRLFFNEIKNGTLSVWDCVMDGFTGYYSRD